MNTCNFTKAPLRDYYADLWRNIAEAILGCVFSHWGLKVCKPKIISDLFTVIAFIFWTLLTLFLSLVCIQNPLCYPCPWARTPMSIAKLLLTISLLPQCQQSALILLLQNSIAGRGMYGHGGVGSVTHLETQTLTHNHTTSRLSHLFCGMKITPLF